MKDSFILYTEQKAVFDKLSNEQAGKLIKAIYEYVATDTMPALDDVLDLVMTPIKISLDKNNKKYQNVVERNRENGMKGGRPKKPKEPNGFSNNPTKPKKADNEYDNDNEYDDDIKDIYPPSEDESSSGDIVKASKKHKYGEYKHVLLKDEELQALKESYPNWEALIKHLDEYIEMKGYKAKSHYLAIKKWVVKAVKKETVSEESSQDDEWAKFVKEQKAKEAQG